MVRPEFRVFSKSPVNVPSPARALRPERPGQNRLAAQLRNSQGHLPLLSHGDLEVGDIVLSELAEMGRVADTEVTQIRHGLLGEHVLCRYLLQCRRLLYLSHLPELELNFKQSGG